MSDAHTDQSRELIDGKWYWVRFETGYKDEVIQAPAMYKAPADAWYSFQFSGIPTFQVEVVGPINYAIASNPAESASAEAGLRDCGTPTTEQSSGVELLAP